MKTRLISCLVAAALLTGCAVQPGVGFGVGAGTGGMGIGLGAGIGFGAAKAEEKDASEIAVKDEKPAKQRKVSRDLLAAQPRSFITAEEKAEYQELAFMAIMEEIYDPDIYAGKSCQLAIGFTPAAKVETVRAEGGDPALCSAAIAAAKSAKFPPFMSDAEARALHRTRLAVEL